MSQSRGEGRSDSEKAHRVIETPASRARRHAAVKAEQVRWESMNGPVITTRKKDLEAQEEARLDAKFEEHQERLARERDEREEP